MNFTTYGVEKMDDPTITFTEMNINFVHQMCKMLGIKTKKNK